MFSSLLVYVSVVYVVKIYSVQLVCLTWTEASQCGVYILESVRICILIQVHKQQTEASVGMYVKQEYHY